MTKYKPRGREKYWLDIGDTFVDLDPNDGPRIGLVKRDGDPALIEWLNKRGEYDYEHFFKADMRFQFNILNRPHSAYFRIKPVDIKKAKEKQLEIGDLIRVEHFPENFNGLPCYNYFNENGVIVKIELNGIFVNAYLQNSERYLWMHKDSFRKL